MNKIDLNNPLERNPLKFSDVAYAASVQWCVCEAAALKFLEGAFPTPREALHCLRDNQLPPDAFWESL